MPAKRESMLPEIYIIAGASFQDLPYRNWAHASSGKTFASTHLFFANNSSKGQIWRTLLNWMGLFDTLCMVKGDFDASVNFVPLLKFTHLFRGNLKVVLWISFLFSERENDPKKKKGTVWNRFKARGRLYKDHQLYYWPIMAQAPDLDPDILIYRVSMLLVFVSWNSRGNWQEWDKTPVLIG